MGVGGSTGSRGGVHERACAHVRVRVCAGMNQSFIYQSDLSEREKMSRLEETLSESRVCVCVSACCNGVHLL